MFFFDEAHLLFNDAPQVLLDKIEQVIRLIRSKGVGVWFVSQNPSDSGQRARSVGEPRAARPARVYTEGSESGENRRANHARQPGI